MNTLLLDANKIEDIKQAASLLKQGKLVAIPTETVYGLAANIYNSEAIHGIFLAKWRPQDNPLIIHISAYSEVELLVTKMPLFAEILAQKFWPGPFTMILPKAERISNLVSGGLDSVAIRCPQHSIARNIIKQAGVPLAAPSANLSGSPSPTTADHVIKDMQGRISAVLDGGACSVGLESTVLSLVGERPRLLRPGFVTIEELQSILPDLEVDNSIFHAVQDHKVVSSPGIKYKHYAPNTKVILVKGNLQAFEIYVKNLNYLKKKIAVLCFTGEESLFALQAISYGRETVPEEQAQNLFSVLRRVDDIGVDIIYARCPTLTGVGLAVYNRLVRAAGFDVIDLA